MNIIKNEDLSHSDHDYSVTNDEMYYEEKDPTMRYLNVNL